MKTLDPAQMKRLVLAVGLAVLGAVALVMFARGVDRVEVIATLLFVPVFIGLVVGRVAGGVGMGVVAAVTYAALRYPAIEAVGLDRFAGLLASRALGYIVFGGIGGWATQTLEASLTKLDLYDRIDDETGLYNARALVQELDLEAARSERYQTIFSLSLVTIAASVFDSVGRRKRRRVLRALAGMLQKSVRPMDRVAHAHADGRHRFALVLPETETQGNEVLTARLVHGVTGYLKDQRIDVPPDAVSHEAITFPDDREALLGARGVFVDIAKRQFPVDEASLSGPEVSPEER